MINSLEMEFIKELEQLMSIKAKELKRNEVYKDIFDSFSPDIEEVH